MSEAAKLELTQALMSGMTVAYHAQERPDRLAVVSNYLFRQRFTEPVMDVERIILTYRDISTLMSDLKMLGAHNVNAGRRQTLTGKGRIRSLTEAYECYRENGVLPASYEVVYGHAWAGMHQTHKNDSTADAIVPISQIQHRSLKG